VQDAIQVGYRKLRELHGQDLEVAVRCSRADEDRASPFFGRPAEYALGLHGFDDVIAAWRDCCASAFEEGSIRAAVRDGAPLPGKGFAILIMSIVRSDTAVSGVVSTRDPVSRSVDTVLISASRGVGAAAAPEALEGDALVLAKKDVRRKSPLKDLQANSQEWLLGADEVIRLAALGLAVEDQYGCPVRLEWVQDGYTGEFMVLQVNPMGAGTDAPGEESSRAPALEPW
jgi:pyruvate,water dikinase